MMAWVAASGGVRAIGTGGSVKLPVSGWRPGDGPSLSRPVDDTVQGRVSELTVPAAEATVTDADGCRVSVRSDRRLGEAAYLLSAGLPTETQADAEVQVSLRFAGPARVERDGASLRVCFGSPTPVTVGFTERDDDPATVTVPPTPAGVATGISHLSAAMRTVGPERSHPSLRDHPPVLEVGDQLSVPAAVREATPETGIELQVPPSLEYLFVGAPLAYYLGADVSLTEGRPRLVAPEADVEYCFHRLPTFQHGVDRLLRQVFHFDTLVRGVEARPPTDREELLDRYGLDPAKVRGLAPAERLARYFWVTDDGLAASLPKWHFSTYAAPEMGNVESLPYLLDALSLVYLPEASELREPDLLERTLDDFYRSSSQGAGGPVRSVDVVDPELQTGRVHAWLAPGAPIDAFKTTPAAFENRRTYQDHGGPGLDVAVVLNDEAMSDEHAAVADIYRNRSAELPLSVTVHEHLTADELADVFATPNDFVHYIGHCEVDGLACADGTLAAADVDTCRARTFFLNACGSYHEGLDLVESGSVAGAVTLTKVLDRQAAKVGTAFARLLVHGFGLEPAMQLARRRIMMGKDYAVVGDGTYTLAPTEETPVVGWLEHRGEGYRLTCEAVAAHSTGGTYRPPFGDDPYLHGREATRTMDREELVQALRSRPFPVIFEGGFRWSTTLAETLDQG